MNDYTTIQLSKRSKKTISQISIVDSIDSDLAELNWHILNKKYVARHERKDGISQYVYLHRIILARKLERDELLPTELVDHIDGNGLNNRRENLRLATMKQNTRNSKRKSGNKTGYKGVSRYKRDKFQAHIKVDGKSKFLGIFDNPKDGHKAYCEAAKLYFGEYANDGNGQIVKGNKDES